uniref:Uncharacterized protein n=1 Tax=Ciona savignyi TaxID=51511 RepID=H2Y609_CIOSA
MDKRPMTPSYDNMRLDICKKEYNIKLRKIFEPGKFI